MTAISITTVLCTCFAVLQTAAQTTPKTLLWKITGGKTTHPSYLFGTMHSKDKRVYYLGDSVYSSIQKCDGFAMELDPGELVDTMVNEMEISAVNVSYKKAIENELTEKKTVDISQRINRLDSMIQKLRQRYEDMSQADINRLARVYRKRRKNDMKTVLDLYLFDLAKRQGKVMGGIEDISDQTSLKDELGNDFDPDVFLSRQRKKYVDVEEWMIANYTNAELDKMYEFSTFGSSSLQNSRMLYTRNNKMTRRMDSLMTLRSSFFAVGAAHLPGDSGVIVLLRKKGFTVTPVFSSKKIEPGDVKLENQLMVLSSFTDPDSNYLVLLPGRPTIITAITSKLKLKTYKELSNDIMLMCGVYEDGDIHKTVEKHLEELKSFYSLYDVKVYRTDTVNRQGLKGYEINFKHPDAYMRLHLFYKEGKVYMFGTGAKNKDSLNAARCSSFLHSYRILDGAAGPVLKNFSSVQKAFSVLLPATPVVENIQGDKTYTKEDITLFSSIDTRNKLNYLVLIREPGKGYFFDFDSAVVKQTLSEIKKDFFSEHYSEETTVFKGYPSVKIRMKGMAEAKSQIVYAVMTVRQNRLYVLSIRGLATPKNEESFETFIESFNFLPCTETTFTGQSAGGQLFSVAAPSPVYTLQPVLTGNQNDIKRTDYYTYDSSTAMSYDITSLGLGKYYWASEKKEMLDEQSAIYFNEAAAVNNISGTDSLVYKKTVFNGTAEGRELLFKSLRNGNYTRLRILQYGDSVFVLNIKADKELCTNRAADQFFNSFRFSNENNPFTFNQPKTALLIADLQSKDNDLNKAAARALLNGFNYPPGDELKLADALLYSNYNRVTVSNRNIPDILSNTLQKNTGEELIAALKNQYFRLTDKQVPQQLLLLTTLSGIDHIKAYEAVKSCLIEHTLPPADLSSITGNFTNRPALSALLFPELAQKIKDDVMALPVLHIANTLLDSNKLLYTVIQPYEDEIVRRAKQILHKYQEANNDNFSLPFTDAVLALLAKMNQKQARSILTDFLSLRNDWLSISIIAELARNKQPVSTEIIDELCKKSDVMLDLYDALINVNATAYFRGANASQRSFADALAGVLTATEIAETVPRHFTLVTVKEAVYKNSKKRFYIYKVDCGFKMGNETYTCILGPFANNDTEFSIKAGEELYLLHRAKFSSEKVDSLFEGYMEKANSLK